VINERAITSGEAKERVKIARYFETTNDEKRRRQQRYDDDALNLNPSLRSTLDLKTI
jgi:hypothetical protein